jgi:hypothetical protein
MQLIQLAFVSLFNILIKQYVAFTGIALQSLSELCNPGESAFNHFGMLL